MIIKGKTENSKNEIRSMLITDSFPPAEGGARLYYYNIYKSFPRDSFLVLTKKVDGWEDFDRKQNIEIIRRSYPLLDWKYKNLIKAIPEIIYSLKLIKLKKINLVHCGDLFPAGIIGFLAKILFRTKYLIFSHGEDLTLTKKYRFQPIIFKHIYCNADVVIAACEFARQRLISMGIKKERIYKITPGVDFKEYKQVPVDDAVYKKYKVPKNKKIVLTICRLIERKGIDSVIKAILTVKQKVPNVIYLVGGRGEYKPKLEELVKELKLEENVKFLGYVAREDVVSLYNICDLFVMCNKELEESLDIEGFGMVFLEANAVGKPVIGGNTGGTGDSIVNGVTGYRVDSTNIAEISGKITYLLDNEEVSKKMGQQGKKRAIEEFDWNLRSEEMMKICEQISCEKE